MNDLIPRFDAWVVGAAILLAALACGVALALARRARARLARVARSLARVDAELQAARAELQQRDLADPLTGLPNRRVFEDRLTRVLSRQRTSARRVALLFVDLDGFRPVNESLGHAVGDALLVHIAARLTATAPDAATLARIGGDEFVLLLPELADPAEAAALGAQVVAAASAPVDYQGHSVQISASVGIALYPEHGPASELLAHADAAMHQAKRAGGNTSMLFQPHMNAGAAQQLALQSDLRQARARGELSLHYQPKFDGRRSRLRGVEALLRWHHPTRGTIPPGVFIPIAERFGLIGDLGDWVIDEACRQMRAWDLQGMRMRVAINLSVHQLRQDDIVNRIEAALHRHRVDSSRLLCEITESVAMEDIQTTQRAFDGLRRIGVFLSIDDFGTGYSSLSYLRKLPATQLKIDRSFILDLEGSADARAVVDAVIRLAHALDLKVVAEGVETEGQRDILLSLACDELQGYLFARPMPATDLLDWATSRTPHKTAEFSPSAFIEEAEAQRLAPAQQPFAETMS